MSLKSFHPIFIFLAALLSLGFAAWTMFWGGDYLSDGLKTGGVVSGGVGVLLVGYGIWFVAKEYKKITN